MGIQSNRIERKERIDGKRISKKAQNTHKWETEIRSSPAIFLLCVLCVLCGYSFLGLLRSRNLVVAAADELEQADAVAERIGKHCDLAPAVGTYVAFEPGAGVAGLVDG